MRRTSLRLWSVLARLTLLSAAVAWQPASAAGQASDPALDSIDALIAAGAGPLARLRLRSWFERHGAASDSPSRERALWLRGRLALDAEAAVADYLRLVREHPEGRFANAARVRLALAAEAYGDTASASAWMASVLDSGPDSASAAVARAWLNARAGPALAATTREDGGGGAPAAEAAPPGAEADAGPFTVQLGAYLSEERAARMVERAGERGFSARIVTVPGSPLFRVRVGRYSSREAAATAARAVGAAGFATYVTDDTAAEQDVR